ncbi:MAG: helix-turn-helix domain-containing protein [Coprobacillaceae bacterium]
MIAENIRLLRKKENVTQEQLGSIIHVSRQTITKWENGLSTPDADNLKRLSEVFNVSLDALVGRDCTNEANALSNKLNIISYTLTTIGIGIFVFLIIVPYIDAIPDRIFIGFLCLLFLSSLGLVIKDTVLRKKYKQVGDTFKLREIIASSLPKDILGNPINIENTKEGKKDRNQYCFFTALTFSSLMTIFDIIYNFYGSKFKTTNGEVIIQFVTFLIVSYLIDKIYISHQIKKYHES